MNCYPHYCPKAFENAVINTEKLQYSIIFIPLSFLVRFVYVQCVDTLIHLAARTPLNVQATTYSVYTYINYN